MIDYNHFSALDIRIGKIISIEVVEDADKLLKLSVDLGEETPRQIISGIREYFEDPQELVGVRSAFVANLEPRVIRGLESQGMILAAHDGEGNFSVLSVGETIPPGTKVN